MIRSPRSTGPEFAGRKAGEPARGSAGQPCGSIERRRLLTCGIDARPLSPVRAPLLLETADGDRQAAFGVLGEAALEDGHPRDGLLVVKVGQAGDSKLEAGLSCSDGVVDLGTPADGCE